ncbi:MAG: ATP-binding protein [Gammaproteobacteria bacterium]|nr:ATP-binding protein [Gammaproteobacteria bacterium]
MNEVAPRTWEAGPQGRGAIKPPPVTVGDSDVVARISAAVHEPFVEAWRRYEAGVWLPIHGVMEKAAAAHKRALSAVAGKGREDASAGRLERDVLAGDGSRDAIAGERGQDAAGALAEYRDAVADEVIEPLRATLAGGATATELEESLASAADHARVSAAELPAMLQAPAARPPVARLPGIGPVRGIKRAAARVLGPVVWRGRVRRVPVARLARQHLDQVVFRDQANAFRGSQHDRAEWLGRLERAWADWAAAVLQPALPADESVPSADSVAEEPPAAETPTHHAAGARLQSELQALIDEVERASGNARSADFGQLEASLAASVAVAGTFAADPPSSRPGPGRQRELAVRWDAWAEGAAARLELYRGLVSMCRDIEGILGEQRGDWSRAVRKADAVLAEVAAELGRSRERATRWSTSDEDLPSILETERQRTDAALKQLHGVLPEPDAVFETLTATVEESIHSLDEVRERMPGALALHDIPAPGDHPRKPTGNPRTVRLREAFLHAFDLLRRERMHAAPSAVREAMHRVRSEVAELQEVSGYGYEAAVAEAKDRRDPGAPDPAALVVNGLSRAGNKAAAAHELLREARVTAESLVAAEIGSASRQLIEQATADRMTAGYLEARTVLSATLVRAWKRTRRLSAQAAATTAAAVAGALGFLRPLSARMGLGPAPRDVVDRREHALAYADEYPAALPVVYRRLFSLEPLVDARLLAGREDALAAVERAWARRATGEARSLVVIAPPGVGVTSFLNVVINRLSEEAPGGVRQRFTTRVQEEARLARSLAGWLGLGEAGDLDSLADRVLAAPQGLVPGFAILEATEHLHMRAPGGGRLFERLLTFMSRTESRVFWIAAMTSTAWQLVEKRAPAFVHDIERVTLGELSPEALRQAVLARHRLSGLPLRFAEPHDGRALLRRRARRLRGSGKQEGLIESDFFQRLHRVSRGSPRLALFYWLRSADFASTAGSLLAQPLSTLESGIENLDREQSFALKAILEHGTLTSDEYCEISRASGPESLHILRSLEECRVIETVPAAVGEKPSVEKGAGDNAARPRYRIRPLMVGAVTAHLRSSNILH